MGKRTTLEELPQVTDASIRYIPLTRGFYATVDAKDFDMLSQFTWSAVKSKRKHFPDVYYAARKEPLLTHPTDPRGRTWKVIFMHRQILRVTNLRVAVDHINGNTLDNRRSQIRIATGAENAMNRVNTKSKSGVRGVFPSGKKWGASIGAWGRTLYLGSFDTKEAAIEARNAKARELHGKFFREAA